MTTTGSATLTTAAYIERIRAEGARLAAAAEPLSLELPVPTCPRWRLRDLLRHAGYVYRWSAGYVTERHTTMVDRLDEAAVLGQDIPDPALLDWFRAGHAALVSALQAADPDLACWTFLPGAASPLLFWARRQAHESAVHRVDVQLAARAADPGRAVDPVPAVLAADGIDELVMGFARRNARRGPLSDPPRALFVAADGTHRWLVRMGPEHAEVLRGWDGAAAGPGDCTVTGPASGVYLLLWNRLGPDGLELAGDPGVLERWQQGVRVTWR